MIPRQPESEFWPPILRDRKRGTPKFDNVRDNISRRELLDLSENERAKQIVAWANWWFRNEKFPGGSVPVTTEPFKDEFRVLIPPNNRVTKENFLQGYHYYRNKWLGSDQHLALEKVLQTANIPFVNRIVAFGITTPLLKRNVIEADLDPKKAEPYYSSRIRHKQSFTQYAILMRMAEYFESQYGQHVDVYVQDPSLQETVEDAMEQLGFKVMDGEYDCQEGFTKINDNTLVYDATICPVIIHIYMEYALPAAVMTPLLDLNGKRMQDRHTPAAEIQKASSILETEYHEVSLIDKQWLNEERRRNDMTAGDIHRAANEQIEEEKKDNDRKIEAQIAAEEDKKAGEGAFTDEATYKDWLKECEEWVVYENLPPSLDDVNCSSQHQLGLYVRKQGVLEASGI